MKQRIDISIDGDDDVVRFVHRFPKRDGWEWYDELRYVIDEARGHIPRPTLFAAELIETLMDHHVIGGYGAEVDAKLLDTAREVIAFWTTFDEKAVDTVPAAAGKEQAK